MEPWDALPMLAAKDQLRQEIAAAAKVIEDRRLAWSQSAASSTVPPLYTAEVIGEVHKMVALGAAGVFSKMGELVAVLEEGKAMESGFGVCRGAKGLGIYVKAYLKRADGGPAVQNTIRQVDAL